MEDIYGKLLQVGLLSRGLSYQMNQHSPRISSKQRREVAASPETELGDLDEQTFC